MTNSGTMCRMGTFAAEEEPISGNALKMKVLMVACRSPLTPSL